MFVGLHQTIETYFVRRVLLRLDQRLLAAVEIDVDEQQPRLDTGDVERKHADRMDVEGAAFGHQFVPHVDRTIPGHPDLVAEIAGIAGSRNVDRDAGNRSAGHAKVLQQTDVGIRDGGEQSARGRSLKRERRNLL